MQRNKRKCKPVASNHLSTDVSKVFIVLLSDVSIPAHQTDH